MKKDHTTGSSREPDGDELMSKRQVAEMLGKNVRTIDNWRKEYGFPSFKLGHSVFFKRRNVMVFMDKFAANGGG